MIGTIPLLTAPTLTGLAALIGAAIAILAGAVLAGQASNAGAPQPVPVPVRRSNRPR